MKRRSAREALGLAWGAICAQWLLRSTRVQFGSLPIVTGRHPKIRNRGRIVVGDRFRTSGEIFASSIVVANGAELHIGSRVFFNQGMRVHASSGVRIGDRVEIGDLVCIYDTNFHEVEPGRGVRSEPIEIGDDCWIGSGAILLPGVNLGRACVVGAGAVVTGCHEAGTVLVGNPARPVRRFPVSKAYQRR